MSDFTLQVPACVGPFSNIHASGRFENVLLTLQELYTSQKTYIYIYFQNCVPPSLLHCVFHQLRHGRLKKWTKRARN